jgi:asparagine synthase (glutamine-hydrolysing)
LSPKIAGLAELGSSYAGAYLLRRGLFMPWELGAVMGRDAAEQGLERLQPLALIGMSLRPEPDNVYAKVATLESSLYMRNQLLRDADWASMAHGVEVRTPLVDATLLRQMAGEVHGLARKTGKSLLSQSPATPLPVSMTRRAKTGFGVPIDAWMKRLPTAVLERARATNRRHEHWSRRWSMIVQVLLATGLEGTV